VRSLIRAVSPSSKQPVQDAGTGLVEGLFEASDRASDGKVQSVIHGQSIRLNTQLKLVESGGDSRLASFQEPPLVTRAERPDELAEQRPRRPFRASRRRPP
jgi:hypothetical protein